MDTDDRPSPEQIEIWRSMTGAQKIMIADQLRKQAFAIKEAALRQQHPDWSDDQIRAALRDWIMYAHT